ncbi:SgcJ/EcaC family oxidoreductase [Catenuloplanes indicus]|uniref:Uncharacterized protein (TIGR02246 family) n=1 Tax=Catenuloplanes indicus TaxID=137267 RepID=A0AAE3VU48_9ACTN|nr:SgcJ/EcaC family oxidoreductase [Catenuloplanes indicus]MDQ0364258.1 uncharacterized protein (TIGR02246 family) [Catenuloplanes indicus]
MTTSDLSAPARADDIAAIERVLATVQHAQNNELPGEFLDVFRDDAVWTTGHGKLLFGLDAIAAFTRQVLPGGMRDSTVTFTLEHVLFIRPDVAAVKVRQSYRTPEGEDLGTPLWIMSKEEGRWLLAACQNTGAPAGELPSPGARPIFGPVGEGG